MLLLAGRVALAEPAPQIDGGAPQRSAATRSRLLSLPGLTRLGPVPLPNVPGGAGLLVLHAPADSTLAERTARLAAAFDPEIFSELEGAAAPAEATAPSPPAPAAAPVTVLLLIAPDEATFRRAAGRRVPEWALAVAFPETAELVLRAPRLVARPAQAPEQVLAHELAHVYLGLLLGDALPAAPRWFQEGVASLAAGEWGWARRVDLALALASGRPLGLERLERGFPASRPAADLAYLESLSAAAYLRGLSGDRGLQVLLRNLRRTGDFDRALRRTYGMTYLELQQRWQETLARRYGWAAAAASSWTTWGAAAVAVVLLVIVRRARYHRRLAEMRRRERMEEMEEEEGGAGGEAGYGPEERRNGGGTTG